MKEILIEELAYFIKEAKKHNRPQPIFFLGAGASVTGNIPLANQISKDILERYSSNPFVKKLKVENQDYVNLMDCLSPEQRNELLKNYIAEAKINVAHIYLAQLLKEGFVDYVLTVNFDNLMLRALALYNIFPPTYDLAILKDLTTTTFNEGSVVYLHGQHHGLWLLNTKDEMAKVKTTVQRIFDSIKNKRPWIFMGYSGSDPIFEHIRNLGRFDNGLYWVGYKDHIPAPEVQKFLNEPNTNSFHIKGYDADAFMLKLNEELGLPQPEILAKPFSSLENMLNDINDINDESYFRGVKERLEIARKNVKKSVEQFEEGRLEAISGLKQEIGIDSLKQEIIQLSLAENYSEIKISKIHKRVKEIQDSSLSKLLFDLYFNWAYSLGDRARKAVGSGAERLYLKAFDVYKKATEISSDNQSIFYNWGTDLGDFAKIQTGNKASDYYKEAIRKLEKAILLDPNDGSAQYNLGLYLSHLAFFQESSEAVTTYKKAIWHFEKVNIIDPLDYESLAICGTCLRNLSQLVTQPDAEQFANEANKMYQQASEIDPNDIEVLIDWGTNLSLRAESKEGIAAKDLQAEALEKFKEVVRIAPEDPRGFSNIGVCLGALSKLESGEKAEELSHLAFENFLKATQLRPNYSDAFFNWANNLSDLAIKISSPESEKLFQESFEKYRKATEIRPDFQAAFHNWGMSLVSFAKSLSEDLAEDFYRQALFIIEKAVELGDGVYNLACLYALRNNKTKGLLFLEKSLVNKEVTVENILNDVDWKPYLMDSEFKAIIETYLESSN